jgi:hypothetical protein
MRDHSNQNCYQLTQPVRPPPGNSLYDKPLTPSAERRAGAFARSVVAAAGSVRRRLSPPSFAHHRNLSGARPPTLRRGTDRRRYRSITATTPRRCPGASEVPIIRKEPQRARGVHP